MSISFVVRLLFQQKRCSPYNTTWLCRMCDTSGAAEDVYRKTRDQRMLPTTDEHFAQIGTELAQGDFRRVKQVRNLQPTLHRLEQDCFLLWSLCLVLLCMS